jgi:hypothetical protein
VPRVAGEHGHDVEHRGRWHQDGETLWVSFSPRDLAFRTHCKVAEEMEENVVVVEEEENGKSAAISGETAKAK